VALFSEARCVVALGYDCEMVGCYHADERGVTHGYLNDQVIQYMLTLAGIAEQADVRLQYFILGQTFEQPVDYLRDLLVRGHDLDQHTYTHFPLITEDVARVCQELADTSAAFEQHLGQHPMGLRGPGGYPQGLEAFPAVQQEIMDQGIAFVSTVYATKNPINGFDLAADSNAYMNLKHLQPYRYGSGLLEIPFMGYSDRNFLDNLERPLDAWIQHLRDCLDFAYDMGGMLYAPDLHPHTHLKHDPTCQVLPALLEHAGSKQEPVRFCTYREVARAASG
jgi:peptidoglycan/xylan/chitin deacetylase (PgdA/CDA1 family)